MRSTLADRLLRAVMNWEDDSVDPAKLALVGVMNDLALYKYNQYQQYRTGLQFIESLAVWLDQFRPDQREAAFDFIRSRLIFVSDQEMRHLVELLFRDVIKPILRARVSTTLGLPKYKVAAIDTSAEFTNELKRSLFLGLSDGARIDELRRSAELNNDQVDGSYFLGLDRVREMRKKMGTKFRNVFLIDDFYGSGKSILRWEKDDNWLARYEDGASADGRLQKFMSLLSNKTFNAAFDKDTALHVCLYVATEQALQHIRQAIDEHPSPPWSGATKPTVEAMMVIPGRSCVVHGESDPEFDAILHEKYDPALLMNEHRRVGGDQIVHGFSDCGLPLVFAHNTPNNSVYLLWETMAPYVALFPRVDRHRAGV